MRIIQSFTGEYAFLGGILLFFTAIIAETFSAQMKFSRFKNLLRHHWIFLTGTVYICFNLLDIFIEANLQSLELLVRVLLFSSFISFLISREKSKRYFIHRPLLYGSLMLLFIPLLFPQHDLMGSKIFTGSLLVLSTCYFTVVLCKNKSSVTGEDRQERMFSSGIWKHACRFTFFLIPIDLFEIFLPTHSEIYSMLKIMITIFLATGIDSSLQLAEALKLTGELNLNFGSYPSFSNRRMATKNQAPVATPSYPIIEEKYVYETNNTVNEPEETYISDEHRLIVEMVQQKIKEKELHKKENFQIQELSEEIAYPIHQVSAAINKVLGKNFSELINECRVEEAKRMLRDKKYNRFSLVAIGFEAGFNSKTSYNTVFKRITGMTPGEFKKQEQCPINKVS